MSNELDFQSISFDLNSHPQIEISSTSNAIQPETTDYSKYLRGIAGINTRSIPCAVICIAFDLLFTLITLVVGGSNLSKCPVEPLIPIYLVVTASVNLVSVSFTIAACCLHVRQKDKNIFGFFYVIISSIVIIILQLFNFIWLILGTIWIVSASNQVQFSNMNEKNYCQEYIYRYTFASIILQYIIPLIICCCKNVPSMISK